MKNTDLKNILKERDNFNSTMEYGKRKGIVETSIDSMEKYYTEITEDKEINYLDVLPEGKEWTSEGSCSVDISVKFFPNLLTIKGILSFLIAIKNWIVDIFKEGIYMISIHPFGKWTNWVFVLDSWDSVRRDMVSFNKKTIEEYENEVKNISKEDVINHLENSHLYFKLNDKFYSEKNDPTCIISIEDHDLRDGYSHKKCIELLNEWKNLIYPKSNFKFIYKD